MRRGDIVTVSASDDCGKPRPAVVIQSDRLTGSDGIIVCLFTSTLVDAPLFRLPVEPSADNGLTTPSQIMIDKVLTLPRHKCGAVISRLDYGEVVALDRMLSVMVGLAD